MPFEGTHVWVYVTNLTSWQPFSGPTCTKGQAQIPSLLEKMKACYCHLYHMNLHEGNMNVSWGSIERSGVVQKIDISLWAATHTQRYLALPAIKGLLSFHFNKISFKCAQLVFPVEPPQLYLSKIDKDTNEWASPNIFKAPSGDPRWFIAGRERLENVVWYLYLQPEIV